MNKSVTKTAGPAWAVPSPSGNPVGHRHGGGCSPPAGCSPIACPGCPAGRGNGRSGPNCSWPVLLAPVNWGLEAFKWAELMPWGPLDNRIREVLYSTAWSLIGRFRMGAVVGRVAAVRKVHRNHALRAFATGECLPNGGAPSLEPASPSP